MHVGIHTGVAIPDSRQHWAYETFWTKEQVVGAGMESEISEVRI